MLQKCCKENANPINVVSLLQHDMSKFYTQDLGDVAKRILTVTSLCSSHDVIVALWESDILCLNWSTEVIHCVLNSVGFWCVQLIV